MGAARLNSEEEEGEKKEEEEEEEEEDSLRSTIPFEWRRRRGILFEWNSIHSNANKSIEFTDST